MTVAGAGLRGWRKTLRDAAAAVRCAYMPTRDTWWRSVRSNQQLKFVRATAGSCCCRRAVQFQRDSVADIAAVRLGGDTADAYRPIRKKARHKFLCIASTVDVNILDGAACLALLSAIVSPPTSEPSPLSDTRPLQMRAKRHRERIFVARACIYTASRISGHGRQPCVARRGVHSTPTSRAQRPENMRHGVCATSVQDELQRSCSKPSEEPR
jgi:hypothetical protein